MISNDYSNKILQGLMCKDGFPTIGTVYLGLCASEPAKKNGSLINAGEPAIESYARVKIASRTGTSASGYSYDSLFGAASEGEIKNTSEIKFNSARKDYPNKINYWFLSTSQQDGVAYLWGRIKDDFLGETKTVTGFALDSTFGPDITVSKSVITTDTLLDLNEDVTYVISWDDKEYDVIATSYEKDGITYIHLGNTLVSGGEDNGLPFGILYNVITNGVNTTGNLTIYALDNETSHNIAIYGLGITVKNATVPTFYENNLKASLDA